MSDEVLVVASKMKKYIKDSHGLNTSAAVMPVLSDLIRKMADDAANTAKNDGRKTLLDRDFTNND